MSASVARSNNNTYAFFGGVVNLFVPTFWEGSADGYTYYRQTSAHLDPLVESCLSSHYPSRSASPILLVYYDKHWEWFENLLTLKANLAGKAVDRIDSKAMYLQWLNTCVYILILRPCMHGFACGNYSGICTTGKGTRRRGRRQYMREVDRGNDRGKIGDLTVRRRGVDGPRRRPSANGHVIDHRRANACTPFVLNNSPKTTE